LAGELQAAEPLLLVEHLGPVGHEPVHAHVLDPRRVPDEPGERVDAGVRALADLGLG
jgi:hypothetical protein